MPVEMTPIAPPVGEVTICNLALARIGATAITALTDTTLEGVQCNLHYAATRDALLRSHAWRFALAWVDLVEYEDGDPDPWAYEYTLPADFLRFVSTEPPPTPFEIDGQLLRTDEDSMRIHYVRQETDPDNFDPLFIEALVVSLAAKICMPLLHDKVLQQQLADELPGAISRARLANMQESKPQTKTTWLDAGGG